MEGMVEYYSVSNGSHIGASVKMKCLTCNADSLKALYNFCPICGIKFNIIEQETLSTDEEELLDDFDN